MSFEPVTIFEVTGADRTRRWRERNARRLRAEQVRARGRARVAELHLHNDKPACDCCGEQREVFLVVVEGPRIYCRNCAFAWTEYGWCPHAGGIASTIG